jgi:hypothetical protein
MIVLSVVPAHNTQLQRTVMRRGVGGGAGGGRRW